MDNETEAGQNLLADLFEANRKQDAALFEQGLKIQAMELTLRSFPDTKPTYEEALKRARTPEVVREFERSQSLAFAAIAAIRKGQLPSA
jgi:hypothetical protein